MRVVVCFIVLVFATGMCRADEWTSLFNGKDLSGWRANNDVNSFAVKEGVLRVQASGKTSAHLFYVGDLKDGFEKFKNFELEATVQKSVSLSTHRSPNQDAIVRRGCSATEFGRSTIEFGDCYAWCCLFNCSRFRSGHVPDVQRPKERAGRLFAADGGASLFKPTTRRASGISKTSG